jgi:hypothetical protein
LLEDRLSPATLTVNSTADTASDSDTYLSLREAVAIVNSPTLPTDLSQQIQGQISGTLHASSADTIQFDPAAVTGPIVLGGTQLELTLPGTTASITIDGGTAGVTVDGNNASRIFQVDIGGVATLAHLTLTHGRAAVGDDAGGGIRGLGSNVTVSSCSVMNNTATFEGGGIDNDGGTMTVVDSTLRSNTTTAGGGGGIDNVSGVLTLSNSTLGYNSATQGGGIANSGTMTVTGSTLSANSAIAPLGNGGAIWSNLRLTVTDSTLTSNSASEGGGIYNVGPVTVDRCTLESNSANFGGGILAFMGIVQVNDSTLAGNSADFEGGGIFVSTILSVTNSTLSGNSAAQGGGVYGQHDFSLQNTIVAGNSAGTDPDISPTAWSGDYNLVGGNPQLSPLGYYGGPTPTMPLLPGSPALGAGDPSLGGSADQRGQPRIGGSFDIGSFQSQPDPFLVTTLTDPGRQFGLLSLREAVNLADVLPGNNTVSFDPALNYGTVTLTAGQLELSGSDGVRTIDGGNRITLDGNHASRVFLIDAGVHAVLTRLVIGNGSSDAGGGIFNSGTLIVANSTLFGNAAILGGALYNEGTLTLDDSTAGFNFAYYEGGGLDSVGQATVFNSTFADNTAFDHGGAIAIAGGSATLTSLTISLNVAASGGGLAAAVSVLLHNSIVAGNRNDSGTATSDVSGTLLASSSYNLIGTGGSGGLVNGTNHNLVGVDDPGLSPPDFNTPLTPVFGLTSSSPARGAGDPTLLSDPLLRLDQHGNVRSNPPNIGAV